MRHAGRIVGECHLLLRDAVRPGVTTAQLNGLVHDYITRQDGVPSFLGYPGPTPYPAATCSIPSSWITVSVTMVISR